MKNIKAVILAAGRSTRTYPLTVNKPKPMLKVGGKTLLEHNLDQLNGLVDEVVLIVGFKASMIRNKFKSRYKKLKLSYIIQKQQKGTGHAVSLAEKKVKDRFIVLMADDLYIKDDIKRCLKHRYSVLAKKVKNPSRFGVYTVKNNCVVDLVEKPKDPKSKLANAALYVLDKKIFDELKDIKRSKRNELELTDAVRSLAKKEKVRCIAARRWISVGYPWNLFNVKKFFGIKGNDVGKNCRIKGKVVNSIVMDGAVVEKGSVVKDSIIGEKVYFKGKALSKKGVIVPVKKKRVRVSKLGCVIGDKAHVEVDLKPGSMIWPGVRLKGK